MDLQKAANLAQILSLVGILPAAYCAYGTWVILHPNRADSNPVNPATLYLCFGAFIACAVIGGIAAWVSRSNPTPSKPYMAKLHIHSAMYGTSPANDIDVCDVLQKHTRDALAVLVSNNLFGHDPAEGHPKRLEVKYSYGNGAVVTTTRAEGSRLVLPEDSWMKGEIKRFADLIVEMKEEREKHEAQLNKNHAGAIAILKEEFSNTFGVQKQEHADMIDKWGLEVAKAKAQRAKLLRNELEEIEKAGVLFQFADDADSMNAFLETVWHLYNDDKRQTEGALLYPLSGSVIPDEITEWRHKELWRFRTLYRAHLRSIKEIDPNFHTNTVDLGFPRDVASYLEVRNDLYNHAAFLRKRANEIVNPFAALTG